MRKRGRTRTVPNSSFSRRTYRASSENNYEDSRRTEVDSMKKLSGSSLGFLNFLSVVRKPEKNSIYIAWEKSKLDR